MRRILTLSAFAVLAAAVAVGALAPGAGAAAGFVQGNAAAIRSGTVNRVALNAPVAAGDVVVLWALWDNAGTVAVTDSAGGVWQPVAGRTAWGQGWSSQLWWTTAKGGSLTVTETFASPITRFGQGYADEYTGVTATPDAVGAATGSGATMAASVAVSGPAVVFVAAGTDNTQTGIQGAATRSTAFDNRAADLTAAGAGTVTVTGSQNGGAWVENLVAFRLTAGATSTTATTQPTTTSTTGSTTTTTMMMGGPDACTFTTFCDAFQVPNPGGRGGDLDEAKWSFSRLQQATNPGQGQVNNYASVQAQFCKTTQQRIADDDSFICGEQFGESNHWMEAMNDNGQYVSQGARIEQPFDFANRTGTLDLSVDAKSEGTHSSWVDLFLTADPDQQPHEDFPGTHLFPQDGVLIDFAADWCPGQYPNNQINANAVRNIRVYHDHQETVVAGADMNPPSATVHSPCFTTAPDMANHVQVKVSQSRIEVWASNDDGSNFSLRLAANVNLPFSRGYWTLEHAQYNACKFNNMCQTTYHWHAVSFDGPVLPVDRAYQVLDALQPRGDGTVNLGYQTNTPTFALPAVNPTGATAAHVTLDVYWYSSPLALRVTLNGHVYTAPPNDPNTASHRYQWSYIDLPVNLTDLVAGTNTLKFDNTGCADQCPTVANADLVLTG